MKLHCNIWQHNRAYSNILYFWRVLIFAQSRFLTSSWSFKFAVKYFLKLIFGPWDINLLSHRNDCSHPSRLVITIKQHRRYTYWYDHQLTGGGCPTIEASPLDTARLINPINPTGYRLIYYYPAADMLHCVVSVTWVYTFLALIFFKAHRICLIGGMLK